MKPLYTDLEFNNAKSHDNLPCECYQCYKTFYLSKHKIQCALNLKQKTQGKYCSQQCKIKSEVKCVLINCLNCNKEFYKQLNQIKKSKNHFCSSSCAATYNNTHKTKGNRRSKLEIYLEEQLTLIYPNLEIHFNKKDTINSELDIFIPSLKLAFELNGIFHYEPIFGKNKLNNVQNNDNRKFQACLEQGIELCIIDSSKLVYFKPSNVKIYLDIITNIISKNLHV